MTHAMLRALRPAIGAAFVLLAACGGSAPDSGGEVKGDDSAIEHRAAAAPKSPRARGVVLFIVDTLRADRLSTYGHSRETSPNLTRFGRRGTRWTNNYAQGSWTVPSMLSMMTGLYLSEESESLPANQPALAELLSENGVETAAFIGNRVAGRPRGFDRGFDHVVLPDARAKVRDVREITATEWVEEFEAWHVQRSNADQPWFAWIHVLDPHTPHEPTKAFDVYDRERTKDETELLVPRWRDARAQVDEWNQGRTNTLGHSEAATAMLRARSAYDGEVLQADAGFGRLLTFLDANGGLDEVLVIFASDHGEMLYEYLDYPKKLASVARRGARKGLMNLFTFEHTGYLYEEVWRTPLMMSGPGIAADVVVDDLSENLDIFPTVLAALGVDYDGPFDGRNKLAEHEQRNAVFGHGISTTAVRTRDGRILVEHPAVRFELPEDGPSAVQLLASGPSGRAVDRSTERPNDVAELRAMLDAWRGGIRFQINSDIDRVAADEALRALGYLTDDE